MSLENLVGLPNDSIYKAPYVLLRPEPGFCLKTFDSATKKKIFINICHLRELPEPPSLENVQTEEYRVPMSVGDVRYELDSKGNECTVIDVAFNTRFLQTTSKSFFFNVIKHAVLEKYKIDLTDEAITLKNKKHFGQLQNHRIRASSINNNTTKKLVEEIQILNSIQNGQTPKFRVFKIANYIMAEILLPYLTSANEFTLDVGEDRIVFESKNTRYFLDTFLPVFINNEKIEACFLKEARVLQIKMLENILLIK